MKEERIQCVPDNTLFSCFLLQTLALSYMSGTISRFVLGTRTHQESLTFIMMFSCCHNVLFNRLNFDLYSYYETKAVFLAMGITALVCVAVTIFCFQTKVDGACVCLWLVSGCLCCQCKRTPLSRVTIASLSSFKYLKHFGIRCESNFSVWRNPRRASYMSDWSPTRPPRFITIISFFVF